MSKTSRAVLAAFVVIALSATTGATQAPAQTKTSKTIAFLLSGPDIYYQNGLKGAEAAAARLGYSVKVYPNPNISPSVELANVRNAIAQGASAITGYSVGLSTEDASISAAQQAKVPIFLMYGYSSKYLNKSNVIGFEQVNTEKYGYDLGLYVKAHGPAGQVGIITGQLGRGDAEAYRTGFLEGLGCTGNVTSGEPPLKCGKFDYVATETGHWLRPDGYKAAQDMIAKYPNLKILFSENDDMAVGIHTALVAAHKDQQVYLVSMNGAPYGIPGVQAGWIKVENCQSPGLEGLMAVRLVDAYLNHKIQGGKLYYSSTVLVTKSTVNKVVGWEMYKNPALVTKYMNAPLPTPVAAPPL